MVLEKTKMFEYNAPNGKLFGNTVKTDFEGFPRGIACTTL